MAEPSSPAGAGASAGAGAGAAVRDGRPALSAAAASASASLSMDDAVLRRSAHTPALDRLRGLLARGDTPRRAPDRSALPPGARVTAVLPAAQTTRGLVKLEVISAHEMTGVRMVNVAAMAYNLSYLIVVVLLARMRWSLDPTCLADGCRGVLARSDFRAIVWFNFVVIAVVTSVALLFSLYVLYLYCFVTTERRPEVLWALTLLLPVVTLTNNPALNYDRIEVLPKVGVLSEAALSVARYTTVAYAIFGVTLYLILKFGSLERAADLSEVNYGRAFYAMRVVPMVLLFVGFLAAGIVRRVEFSPQPIVPLVSLARNGHFGVSFPSATISATAAVGSLQVLFLIFFVVRYIVVSRRIVHMNYRQARLKVINVFFLFSHTIVPLSVCVLATAVAASLWPTPLTLLALADHKFAEEFVLDVPFYARSGIVLVFTTWTLVETFVSIPSVYKPTFLERVLIKRMGMQPGAAFAPATVEASSDEVDLEAPMLTWRHTFGLAAPKLPPKPTTILGDDGGAGAGAAVAPSDGHVVWKAPKAQSARERALTFRFDETVLAWNFSWLAYLSDDVIVRAMNDNSHTLALHRTWRESMFDQCVLMATSPDMIVVAFRGSVSAVNMKTNLHMSQTRHPPDGDPEWMKGMWKAPTWGQKSPTFHRGFSNAYASVSAGILEDLRAENERIPGRRIICCGHSLGGALATLAAFDCRVGLGLPDELVTCITFGSPRVGNTAFVRRFAVTVSDSWRVTNLHDFVTNYPKRKVQQYDHVPRCALATLDGNLILDPRFADLKLMHGSSIRAHLLGTYKETLQAFVDVAHAQSPPDEPFDFEPDWWDFAQYNADEVPDDGLSKLGDEPADESAVKDKLAADDVFEGLPKPHRAVQSLPSNPVVEREPVSRSGVSEREPVSRRGMLNLQWAKGDFKALDGDADLLHGGQSMLARQSSQPSPRSQRSQQ